jgi:Holliday junction resolvasome RuvABC endonuclease subunit
MILGLDLSVTATGWCSFESATNYTTGVFGSDKLNGLPRLTLLRERLGTLIDAGPELAVIEGYGYAARQGNLHTIVEWGGVARMALYDAGIPMLILPPTSLKLFASGAGNTKKNEMLLAVFKRWGADFRDDNQCDAFALSAAGAAYLSEYGKRGLGKMTEEQTRAMKAAAYIPRKPSRCRERSRKT